MGKRKDVTNDKKIAVETLLKTGIYSHREIARRAHVSRFSPSSGQSSKVNSRNLYGGPNFIARYCRYIIDNIIKDLILYFNFKNV